MPRCWAPCPGNRKATRSVAAALPCGQSPTDTLSCSSCLSDRAVNTAAAPARSLTTAAIRTPSARRFASVKATSDNRRFSSRASSAASDALAFPQRLGAAGREQQNLRTVRCRGRPAIKGSLRRLLEDDVHVRATDTERAHPGPARTVRLPCRVTVLDDERPAVKVQFGIGRGVVQGRRNRLVLQAQDGLDKPGDARRHLEVPDVRLDRTQHAGAGRSSPRLRRPAQRLDLDRVADRRAGAVGLDVADRRRRRRRRRHAPRRRPRPGRRRSGAREAILAEPSLLIAEPRMTAWIRSPSSSASWSGLSTTTPTPLPKTVPSARASKARQWPSRRQIAPGLVAVAATVGHPDRTPPASAMSHSPRGRLWQARCTATSDVEQAVCTEKARPAQVELVRHPRRQEVLVVLHRQVDHLDRSPSPTITFGSRCDIRL